MEWTFSCVVATKEPEICDAGFGRCGASVLGIGGGEECREEIRRCRCKISLSSPGLCTFHASCLSRDVQTYKALPVSTSVLSVYTVCDACEEESDAIVLEMLRNCYGGTESVSTFRVLAEMEDLVTQLRACATEREVVQKRYFRYSDSNQTASHVYFYTSQRKQADCIERVLQRFIRGRERIKAALLLSTPPSGEPSAPTGGVGVFPQKGKPAREAKQVCLSTETLATLHGGDKILAFLGLGEFEHRVFVMLQKLIDSGSWVLLPVSAQVFKASTGLDVLKSDEDNQDCYMYVAKLGFAYVCTFCFLEKINLEAHTLCVPVGTLKASSTLFGVLHSLFVYLPVNYILRRGLCGGYSQLRRAGTPASISVRSEASPGLVQIAPEHADWFQFIDRICHKTREFEKIIDEGKCKFGKGLYAILRSNDYGGMSRLLPEICGFLKEVRNREGIEVIYTDYVTRVNSVADCASHGLPDVEFNLLREAGAGFQPVQHYADILGRKMSWAVDNFRQIYSAEKHQFRISNPIAFGKGIWWIIRHDWWLDCIEQD